MRALFLSLMIVLLPLRGWVGDAMAMEMLPSTTHHAPHATNMIAPMTGSGGIGTGSEAHAGQQMPGDCPGHVGPQEVPADSPQQATDEPCGTCTACQICHSVALAPVSPQLETVRVSAIHPQMTSRHYASAERAPGFKPPIS